MGTFSLLTTKKRAVRITNRNLNQIATSTVVFAVPPATVVVVANRYLNARTQLYISAKNNGTWMEKLAERA